MDKSVSYCHEGRFEVNRSHMMCLSDKDFLGSIQKRKQNESQENKDKFSRENFSDWER